MLEEVDVSADDNQFAVEVAVLALDAGRAGVVVKRRASAVSPVPMPAGGEVRLRKFSMVASDYRFRMPGPPGPGSGPDSRRRRSNADTDRWASRRKGQDAG